MDIGQLTVVGIPFLVVVFGLVEFTKKLGLSGKALTVGSMAFGILFGVALKVAEMYPDFNVWFEVGFFGLAIGLAASGIYDFLNNRFPTKE